MLERGGIDPQEAASIPPFDCHTVRKVARTFKERTAVGAGKLSPRDLVYLPDRRLTILGLLWHWMLDTGRLPSQ
eukprot:6265150-Pyramimonas_sp.AAC.1